MGTGYELGRAVEFLIHEGHPPDVVWRYTPRQIQGWIQFAFRRKLGERAEMMATMGMASRGDPKELKKQMRSLEQESR